MAPSKSTTYNNLFITFADVDSDINVELVTDCVEMSILYMATNLECDHLLEIIN